MSREKHVSRKKCREKRVSRKKHGKKNNAKRKNVKGKRLKRRLWQETPLIFEQVVGKKKNRAGVELQNCQGEGLPRWHQKGMLVEADNGFGNVVSF